ISIGSWRSFRPCTPDICSLSPVRTATYPQPRVPARHRTRYNMSASTRVSNRKSRILLRLFCFVKTRSHLVHPSTVLGSRCLLMADSGQLALLLAQKLNFALTKLIRGSLQLTSEPGFPARSGNLPSRH